MRIYHHDNESTDCRLPHDSGDKLSQETLSGLGILYYSLPVEASSSLSELESIARARNYANRDEIAIAPSIMGASYDEKIDMFFREHIHEDEEIRYILDGKGYFDVRDKDDKWIRIFAEPGDMLILPAGIYHRFTVDEDNYIKAMRLFQTSPQWAALNRSDETEVNPYRKAYIEAREKDYSV